MILRKDHCSIILNSHVLSVFILCVQFTCFVCRLHTFGYACRDFVAVALDLRPERLHDPVRGFLIDVFSLEDLAEYTPAVLRRGIILCSVVFQHLPVQLSCAEFVCLYKIVDLLHAEDIDQGIGRAVVARREHGKELIIIFILHFAPLHLLQVASGDVEFDQAGGDHGVVGVDADLFLCVIAVQVQGPLAILFPDFFAKTLLQRLCFGRENCCGLLPCGSSRIGLLCLFHGRGCRCFGCLCSLLRRSCTRCRLFRRLLSGISPAEKIQAQQHQSAGACRYDDFSGNSDASPVSGIVFPRFLRVLGGPGCPRILYLTFQFRVFVPRRRFRFFKLCVCFRDLQFGVSSCLIQFCLFFFFHLCCHCSSAVFSCDVLVSIYASIPSAIPSAIFSCI